jgi:hypothetical protein
MWFEENYVKQGLLGNEGAEGRRKHPLWRSPRWNVCCTRSCPPRWNVCSRRWERYLASGTWLLPRVRKREAMIWKGPRDNTKRGIEKGDWKAYFSADILSNV